MPTEVSAALGRMTNAIREFTVAQRTIAIIGVAVLVLGAAALGIWVTRPTLSPLFSGLSGADASAIVDQLTADGVEYELADGGATIMVPAAQVDAERLKAAANGLPSLESGGGYGLLDSMGVTASEFQQTVTYKRALEGELAKTIEALDGVSTASVRLAIPEQTVFVSEKQDPTASVFIETERGISLSSEQVQAVTHLTSASVDGLTPNNVAVVSADGTVLSAVGTGATGSTDQQSSDYEERVRTAVQSMLDKVVGVGNATVVVAADMSLESAQRVEETFENPDGSPVLSESTTSENYGAGADGTATGVLGPDNIAVPSTTAGGATDGSYLNETATRNNAINKVTETRIIPAGTISRQTVSVAVNADAAAGIDEKAINALVTAAAGINVERGDSVNVELVSFTTVGAEEAATALKAAKEAEATDNMTKIITAGVITAGALIGLIILLLAAKGARKRRAAAIELGVLQAEEAAARLQAVDPLDLPRLDAPPAPRSIAPTSPAFFDPTLAVQAEPVGIDRMRADIDALAESNPEKAAEYLRTLMDDRQNA